MVRFWAATCRLGRGLAVAAGGFGGGGILFRGLFVAFAAVIGAIEAAALEEQAAPGADFAFHAAAAPFFLTAKLLRANPQRPGRNGLKDFKLAPAFFTDVFVSRHDDSRMARFNGKSN
jgi:hypothetical protein